MNCVNPGMADTSWVLGVVQKLLDLILARVIDSEANTE